MEGLKCQHGTDQSHPLQILTPTTKYTGSWRTHLTIRYLAGPPKERVAKQQPIMQGTTQGWAYRIDHNGEKRPAMGPYDEHIPSTDNRKYF